MKKSNKIAIAAAVAALAFLVLPRVLRPKEQVAAASLPVVRLEKPEKQTIELQSAMTGSVEPSDIVYIIPKMGGEVKEVYVKSGDVVQEGQLLCQIDTKQVDSIKISMDQAAVAMEDANNNLARMRVLFENGDISKQQFEQAESNAKMSKLNYESAQIAYNNQMEYSSITAPIGGLVESFKVEVHDNLSPQDVVCVISGEGTKAVSFNVPERVVKGLSVGDNVRIEKNGSEYHGTITELSTMVDGATGLFRVKAALEGTDALATGVQVKLYVTSEKAENVLSVPTNAVYYEGGEPRVYVCRDGAVAEQPVETGIYNTERTEIKSGLTEQDDVIVTWSSELFEGSKVEIYSEDTEEAGQSVAETETK